MSPRIKHPTTEKIEDTKDFEETINTIAKREVEIAGHAANRDEEILGIKERYNTKIKKLQEANKADMKLAAEFAGDHRYELIPKGARSTETALAAYGFRKGQPRLKTLARWTWEKVEKTIKELGWQDTFIRTKEEPNKEAILEHGKKEDGLTDLRRIGLTINQTDSFFVEPKIEEDQG
jgi:phage host-nuclease inhibitor protein Gam